MTCTGASPNVTDAGRVDTIARLGRVVWAAAPSVFLGFAAMRVEGFLPPRAASFAVSSRNDIAPRF